MLKHFNFFQNGYGRVGVLVKYDFIEVFQVAGVALPVEGLLPLLKKALSSEDILRADELNMSRKNDIVVEKFRGMSGTKNYVLRSLKDEKKGLIQRCATLHISMYGKLNEGLKCWLGDLPELLAAAEIPSNEEFLFEEAEIKMNLPWGSPKASLEKMLGGNDDTV